MNFRLGTCAALATLAVLSGGCGGHVVTKHIETNPAARPVAQDATREELLDKYNKMALGVLTLNATLELKPTAGSNYSGVIDEYHEVKTFLLAVRPAEIRMIGQAPVIGTTVFDMTSDGQTFHVSIPSKHKFLVGPVAAERTSAKPIENLRPQHLLDALLWPEVRKEEAVLFEEFNDENARYYILTVLRGGYHPEIYRKIWFDRATLQVARLQSYGPRGTLFSDVRVSDWQAPDAPNPPNAGAAANAPASFPRAIHITRPHDDYQLNLQITKITLNEQLPAERFHLEQPAGSELIQVNENTGEKPATNDGTPKEQKP